MADPEGWMDLGDCRRIGCNIHWCCTSCYASAEATPDQAIARHGAAKTLHVLQQEARCKACGGGARVFTGRTYQTPAGGLPDGNVNFSTPGNRLGPEAEPEQRKLQKVSPF